MSFELHADLKRDGLVIGAFDLSLVLMINDSAYPWFVLVPKRTGILDAYQLSFSDHRQLTIESRELCETLMAAFKGKKMNVAALGNMTPQLHVHHVVRFKEDPAWPGPIWGKQPLVQLTEQEVTSRLGLIEAEQGTEQWLKR